MGGLRNPDNLVTYALVAFAAIIGGLLAAAYQPNFLSADTAQYVVTARHLVRGEGLVTSLLYFDEQMATGEVPAPQTVWPPGYPVLIGLVMAAGANDLMAPFVLALASHLIGVLVLYALLRRAGCVPWIAGLGGVMYCASSLFSALALRGLSEGTFTLCTLLAAVCVVSPSPNRRGLLFAAGLFAAGAFMVRYAGISFIAAFGVTLAFRFLLRRTWESWWDAVIAMAPCFVAVVGLFWRNYVLTSTVTGGPTVERGGQFIEVLRRFYWSFGEAVGMVETTGAVLAGVLVCSSIGLVLMWVWAARSWRVAWQGNPVAELVALGLSYLAFTVLLYGYLGYVRIPEMVTGRYLLPLLPFGIVAVCLAATSLLQSVRVTPPYRVAAAAAFALAFVSFLAIQGKAADAWSHWLRDDRRMIELARAMDQPAEFGTLGDFVRQRRGEGPVLSKEGQLLGMLLDIPSVGLAESFWTSRTWTTEAVRALVRKLGITVVCVFPELFDATSPSSGHWQFLVDLETGQTPPWLELAASTPSVRIYLVRSDI